MHNVTVSGLARNTGRALRRRCPACGGKGVWRSWFASKERCPHCGIRLDRGEPDFFLGAYLVNFVVAELLFAVLLVTWILLTWPNPPWNAITVGSVILVVVLPIFFYPYTRGIWLGVDLLFRPYQPGEVDP
jgi:uncharacterized protein (DUF983 family)